MQYRIKVLKQDYSEILLTNDNQNINVCGSALNTFRFFHDDICEFDEGSQHIYVVQSSISSRKIVGKVVIDYKTVHGFNARKNPLFIFIPNQQQYPKFLLAINDKIKNPKQNQQYYAVIKFTQWTKTLPQAQLLKVLGKVGDENAEYIALLHEHNITSVSPKCLKVTHKSHISDFAINIKDRFKVKDANIITIDPVNCLDIDDALSYKYNQTTQQHEVGVHISDVAFWVNFFGLPKPPRLFTIYLPNKQYDIFPNVLARHLLSLKAKQERLCVSLFLYFDNNYELQNHQFKETILSVTKNCSYQSIDKIRLLLKNQCTKNRHIKSVVKSLFAVFPDVIDDSHVLVEKFMITYNHYCAKYLTGANVPCILRSHKQRPFQETVEVKNKKLQIFMSHYLSEPGVYKTYNNSNEEDYQHHGLQLDYYGHFTSPIRRYVDVVNQQVLKQTINGSEIISHDRYHVDIDEINSESQTSKLIHRKINEIYHKHHTIKAKTRYTGFIIAYHPFYLQIYFPTLDFLFHHQISEFISQNTVFFKYQPITGEFHVIENNLRFSANQITNLNEFSCLSNVLSSR